MVKLNFVSFVLFFCACITLFDARANEHEDYEKAISSFNNNELDSAYIYLKNSINKNDTHLPSKILMGKVLSLSFYYDDAIVEFEESLMQGADPNLIMEFLANSLLIAGHYEKILTLPQTRLNNENAAILFAIKAKAASKVAPKKAPEFYQKALAKKADSVSILNAYTLFLLTENDIASAEQTNAKAHQINQRDTETLRLRANIQKLKGNEQQYLATLIEAIDIDPQQPFVLRDLVGTYIEKGKLDKASETLLTVLSMSPKDPMARLLKSYVDALSGKEQQSRNTLEQIINELSLVDVSSFQGSDSLLLISALANYAVNNIEKTKKDLSTYLMARPRDVQAANILADIYIQEGNYSDALLILEKQKDDAEQNPVLAKKLCDAYIATNSLRKCEWLVRQLERNTPSTKELNALKAKILAEKGQFLSAIELINQSDTSDEDIDLTTALLAIEANDFALAEKRVLSLLKTNETSLSLQNLLAGIHIKQGRYLQAQTGLENVLQSSSNFIAAQYNLAIVHYNLGQLDEAQLLVQEVLAQQPSMINASVLLAQILFDTGELSESKNLLSSLLSEQPDLLEAKKLIIKIHTALQEYDLALSVVNRLLKDKFLDDSLIVTRVTINTQKGDFEAVEKDTRTLFSLFSESPGSLLDLALLQISAQNIKGAIKSVNRGLEIAPNNFFLLREKSNIHLLQGQLKKASDTVAILQQQFANEADTYLLAGDVAKAHNKLIVASKHYDKAIALNKNFSQALYKRYLLAMQGIDDVTFVSTFTALVNESNRVLEINNYLADYYLLNLNHKQAKKHYEAITAQKDYPNYANVLNNLAYIYQTESNHQKAIEYANRSIAIDNSNSASLDTLGWSLTQIGQFSEGLNHLRRSYSLDTSNLNTRFHIAYSLYKLGRVGEAKTELNSVLATGIDFSKKNDARELLKQL